MRDDEYLVDVLLLGLVLVIAVIFELADRLDQDDPAPVRERIIEREIVVVRELPAANVEEDPER